MGEPEETISSKRGGDPKEMSASETPPHSWICAALWYGQIGITAWVATASVSVLKTWAALKKLSNDK